MVILTYPDASTKKTAKEEIIIRPSPVINTRTTTPGRPKPSFKRELFPSQNLTYHFFRSGIY